MQQLDKNERVALDVLKQLSTEGNPLEMSLRDIQVPIQRKKFSWKYHTTFASHTTVKRLLEGLQSKGYITLDYSIKKKPKIIVNNEPNPISEQPYGDTIHPTETTGERDDSQRDGSEGAGDNQTGDTQVSN